MTDVGARARELSDTPEHRRLESFIRSYKHVEEYFTAMDSAANKYDKPEEWQEKYKSVSGYLSRYALHYWQCVDRCCEIEYAAWGQALKEEWSTPEHMAEIEEERRRENAREALLPRIQDYGNGHVTYYDLSGDVTGERL